MPTEPEAIQRHSGPDNVLLAVENLGKRYGDVEVLRGVDFWIAPGETVCLLGPNGSGKTTLLRCLNLLVTPSSGRLFFEDRCIGDWTHTPGHLYVDLKEYRRHLGMVFQDFGVFPHLSAIDNVTLGPRRALGMSRADAEARAHALLQRVALDNFSGARPGRLSGGQKQRLAIARALAMEPALMLFDEPTSALDAAMVDEVLNTMKDLASEGKTMIVVTHEHEFARDVADRIVVMDAGAIIEVGPPATIFESPTNPRTREILRSRRRSALPG
jgi:polar amino acid transport system ATP-binding protein